VGFIDGGNCRFEFPHCAMSVLVLDDREATIVKLVKNRQLAHRVLFADRHKSPTPHFHAEIIDRFHSAEAMVCEIAFRGSAKSTIAEEGITFMACVREFQHCLITGSSLPKACERLHSIRRQFEKNEMILELFGDLRGRPWGDEMIELSTGITIQAMGRGQALRGTKSEVVRPDFMLCDDIEDKLSMGTSEGTEKIQSWFFTELLPAGDEEGSLRVRMLCNDMGVNCLGNKLAASADSGFVVHRYPWVYKDENGKERPTWPDRFPLEVIERKRRQFFALGRHADYNQEYMCHSETPEDKPFKREMIRVEPQVRTWQAAYACFDPARTINQGACDTGYACWSWIANRLVVWEAWGKKMLPDEIISSIFDCDHNWHPVHVGVDEVGLNEFMLQPVRQEGVKRGITIPLKPLHPPKSKTERIRALQPFANARELIFAQPLPQLEQQLLAFPLGKRDVLDALAYALIMRPGAPMYEDFSPQNVMETMSVTAQTSPFLCLNATHILTVGVLVQVTNGNMRVIADWVREGEPSGVAADIVSLANLEAQRQVKVVLPVKHYDKYNNPGLLQAVKKLQMDIRKGTPETVGREVIRGYLKRISHGFPAILVSSQASWTLNAFSGGYCRAFVKSTGTLCDFAEEGSYRLLMEGLESFAGLLSVGSPDEENHVTNYAYTNDGRKYLSARKV
jgi:hypothetical protein